MLFRPTISLLDLSVTQRRVLKSPNLIVDFSISFFNSISCASCILTLLFTYMLTIVLSCLLYLFMFEKVIISSILKDIFYWI